MHDMIIISQRPLDMLFIEKSALKKHTKELWNLFIDAALLNHFPIPKTYQY